MTDETRAPVANRGAITVSIMLATFMQGVDTTIANVALPHMQGSFSARAGPDRLGSDLLHRRGGDHDAADRLARRPLRHQIRVLDLGRRLHRGLGAVRPSDEPGANGDLPPAAGHLRGGACAAVPIGIAADQPAAPPCPGDVGLGHGGDLGPDHRPGARRLADRPVQLALGVLHQCAVRDPRRHSAS